MMCMSQIISYLQTQPINTLTMKRIAYLLAGIVLAACQSSNEFILEGTLPQPFTGTVYLTYIPAGEALTRIDSVTLDEETDFRFRHAIEHPDAYRVITSPRRYDAAFIAEPQGNYRIDFSSEDYPVPVQVLKGGAEQILMNDYLSSLKDSRRQEQELNAAYAEKLAKGDDASKAQADSLMQLLSDVFQARETNDERLHPPTPQELRRLPTRRRPADLHLSGTGGNPLPDGHAGIRLLAQLPGIQAEI